MEKYQLIWNGKFVKEFNSMIALKKYANTILLDAYDKLGYRIIKEK